MITSSVKKLYTFISRLFVFLFYRSLQIVDVKSLKENITSLISAIGLKLLNLELSTTIIMNYHINPFYSPPPSVKTRTFSSCSVDRSTKIQMEHIERLDKLEKEVNHLRTLLKTQQASTNENKRTHTGNTEPTKYKDDEYTTLMAAYCNDGYDDDTMEEEHINMTDVSPSVVYFATPELDDVVARKQSKGESCFSVANSM